VTGDGRKLVGAGLIGLVIGGVGVAIASRGSDVVSGDRAKVERIVREYVLANPEILPEAMEVLQGRRMAEAVGQNRAAFETPFGSAWAGAEDGDVVLVEFFDYACGYCRKSNADIDRLLKEDKKLKVVWRELPVLGPDSQAAAEVSLAAARQGRFMEFYQRLFAAGRPGPDTISAVQQQLGIRPTPGSPEFQAEIDKNYQLARTINATGTPTFVVGDQVLQGAVGYAALKKAIEDARNKG
jgi:protein-disulfide isomerase